MTGHKDIKMTKWYETLAHDIKKQLSVQDCKFDRGHRDIKNMEHWNKI